MRGKGLTIAAKPSFVRITPAYAGKRMSHGIRSALIWDHPRLCGEKAGNPCIAVNPCRITPAYAGKSMLDTLNEYAVQDHPRLCGEKRKKGR